MTDQQLPRNTCRLDSTSGTSVTGPARSARTDELAVARLQREGCRRKARSGTSAQVRALLSVHHVWTRNPAINSSLTPGSARRVEGCPGLSAQVSGLVLAGWVGVAFGGEVAAMCPLACPPPRPQRQASGRSAAATDVTHRRPDGSSHRSSPLRGQATGPMWHVRSVPTPLHRGVGLFGQALRTSTPCKLRQALLRQDADATRPQGGLDASDVPSAPGGAECR